MLLSEQWLRTADYYVDYAWWGKKRGLTVLGLVNAQSVMQIAFQLHDVLRFDSTVVIDVLIDISSLKLNNQFFLISKYRA